MLPIVSNSEILTMSSREIAELTGKRHDNVRRTIESLWDLSLISVTQSEEPALRGGKPTKIYNINEEDSYIVVARLSPEFTAKIVKRWRELESQQAPKIPQTYAEALQLAADQAKLIEQQSEKIAIDKPKVDFVDKLVDKSNVMNATTIAQKHGKSAIWLNKILKEHDVYSKAIKRGKVFRQWFIQKKLGEMKQTEMGYSQAMFTNAGEIWINELLIAHGYV